VLVSSCTGASRIAEYVQVKGGEPDKLWSVADLCQRKGNKAGTSIFERSLLRDRCNEMSRFRLVTLRPVVSVLQPLALPLGSAGRVPRCTPTTKLASDIEARIPGLLSKKGNGVAYWIANCVWEHGCDKASVEKSNLLRLLKLAESENKPILPEAAEVLLNDLAHHGQEGSLIQVGYRPREEDDPEAADA